MGLETILKQDRERKQTSRVAAICEQHQDETLHHKQLRENRSDSNWQKIGHDNRNPLPAQVCCRERSLGTLKLVMETH